MTYLKLFGFMTVFWSFEFMAHFIDLDEFIIADVLNCLQGFIIFVIFVMQKNVRVLIVKKYRSFRGISDDDMPNNDIAEVETNDGELHNI